MLRNFVFSGNGDAKYVRAQAGRFSYAFYAYFAAKTTYCPDISDR